MTRSFVLPTAWFAGLLVIGAGLLLAGCPTANDSDEFTPITSIYIRSETLVQGHGCGTGDTQVHKYRATAQNAQDTSLRFTGLFDCFADGVFVELPPAASAAADADPTAGPLDYDIFIDAFNKAAFDANPAAPEGGGTWRTTCRATQQAGVPVLARCPPLSSPAEDAGADADEAGSDAAIDADDASVDDASDAAGDDAADDAGGDDASGDDAGDGV